MGSGTVLKRILLSVILPWSILSRTTMTTTKPVSDSPDYLLSPDAVLADIGVQWRFGEVPDYSKTRGAWKEGKQALPICTF